MTCRPLLGGQGSIDENRLDDPSGAYLAVALRLFDAATRTWSIWWADPRFSLLSLDPPVQGRFDGGEGLFLSENIFEGRPIAYPLSLVRDRAGPGAVGAGLLAGRRRQLGGQLDHVFRAEWSVIDRRAFLAASLALPGALEAAPKSASQGRSTMAGNLIELRQYTLYGGRRDELITLFEREFIEPQDALGARVLGLFRDFDDPDRFVWLRGFAGMAARFDALTAFYGGPVWQAHRAAANATMVDSDNVLLLRIAGGAWPSPRSSGPDSLVRLAIHYLGGVDPAAFLDFFGRSLAPAIAAAGGSVETVLLTNGEPNTFPRLPVREAEPALIWLSRFAGPGREAAFSTLLAAQSGWRDSVPAAILPALMRKPEVLRLAPTARSPLK